MKANLVGIFVAVLLLITVAHADQPRYQEIFKSKNGGYEAQLQDGQWKLIDKDGNRELYQFADYRGKGVSLSSMSFVISDDGRAIVVVDDYSEQESDQNPEILLFLLDGKITKTYRINDLINAKFLTHSVSHFLSFYFPNKFEITDGKIDVTMNDLNHFVFDVTNGVQLSKSLDKMLDGTSILVTGPVTNVGKDSYEITVECWIRGNGEKGSRIPFKSKKVSWPGGSGYESLIIRNGELIDRPSIHFNACRP